MRLSVFLLACIFSLCCRAQMTHLICEQKDGAKVFFPLAEKPVATFEGDGVQLHTDKVDISYRHAEILAFTFGTDEAGLEHIASNKADFDIEENAITATDVKPGTRLAVYDANGTLVAETQADTQGCARLETSQLRRGTYIINLGNTAYKYTLR